MIAFEALCAALSQLSGDATRVALVLMQAPVEASEMCVDLSWRTRTARELFVHPKIVERSLKELSDAQLCELTRVTLKRLDSSSMSEGTPNLARTLSLSEAKSRAGSEATSRGADSQALEESDAAKVASVPGLDAEMPSAAKPSRSPSVSGRGARRPPKSDDAPEVASADVQACIAAFDRFYREANSDARPTWGGRQYVQMRQLVEKHGRAEVEKRIAIMFTAPPRWPAPPYDLQTLALHFDKFATPSGKGGMIDRWKSGEGYYGGGQ